ncbi:oligoribonuclease [Mesobacillus campisalis]|uniref:Oligoribonuclease n=1 Tax=Mesobacillus campisalis TaxID=1408103 RepID=A0A0M2SYU6_9BACI|nr:DHHA1 domain-containing protein [Mesobacillus campisalis]KKK37795.1 oligoribonuclease [Mesobacillus campisalis]
MIHVFTHNDLDGVGCGILARLAYPEESDVRYNSISSLNFQLSRFLERLDENAAEMSGLYITDLTVNEENALKIDALVEAEVSVKLIDHHKSALHLNDFSWAKVTVEYGDGRLASATSLFYDELIHSGKLGSGGPISEFVELVRQYDTWEWDENNNVKAKQLNDLFYLLSIDEFEQRMVQRLAESEQFEFDDFEAQLLKMEDEKIERYIRRKSRELVQIMIGGKCAGIVHAESYHSELGNELGKEHTHLDYIAIISMGGKKVSLRTIHDDVDVSAVAGQFGGGGHAKAAGCPLTEEGFKVFVKEVFPLSPIKIDSSRNVHNLKESEYGTLYENNQGETFFIYSESKGNWRVEREGKDYFKSSSFKEAEREIKRRHGAALAKDDVFVKFLANSYISGK